MINQYKKSLKVSHGSSNHDKALVELLQKQNNKFVVSVKIGGSPITYPELETKELLAIKSILDSRNDVLEIAISLMRNLPDDKLQETIEAISQITETNG